MSMPIPIPNSVLCHQPLFFCLPLNPHVRFSQGFRGDMGQTQGFRGDMGQNNYKIGYTPIKCEFLRPQSIFLSYKLENWCRAGKTFG